MWARGQVRERRPVDTGEEGSLTVSGEERRGPPLSPLLIATSPACLQTGPEPTAGAAGDLHLRSKCPHGPRGPGRPALPPCQPHLPPTALRLADSPPATLDSQALQEHSPHACLRAEPRTLLPGLQCSRCGQRAPRLSQSLLVLGSVCSAVFSLLYPQPKSHFPAA